ncbi:SH3 domain-containing kinase-binding protein 1 [Takifugu rubripes]|uniref:SH3 domain-containing kinase-binding protein 1 n=1 Tax=Takifugu rubripes TaxID=31033 RepID=UPI0011452837|nr:SH3 domain-containing kinase-binding protein 1-like [Takifugu rubripes]
MGSYSSALMPEAEEFESIVSVGEKLDERVSLAADERSQSDLQTPSTDTMEAEQVNQPDEHSDVTSEEVTVPKGVQTQSFSSLLPKALSAILNPASRATSDPQPGRHPSPAEVEQLRTELRDLRDQFNQMKTQHNKEIKELMSELDEEKRIRLTLQMEIQRLKKHVGK